MDTNRFPRTIGSIMVAVAILAVVFRYFEFFFNLAQIIGLALLLSLTLMSLLGFAAAPFLLWQEYHPKPPPESPATPVPRASFGQESIS